MNDNIKNMTIATSAFRVLRDISIKGTRFSALIVFLLVPFWLRIPNQVFGSEGLYVTSFLIFNAILICLVLWGFSGFYGFSSLSKDPWRAFTILCLLTLGLWMYMSSAWAFRRADNPEIALNAGLQFMVVGLFLTVCVSVRFSPRWIIASLILGLFWNSVVAALQVALQGSIGGIASQIGEFRLASNVAGVSYIQAGELRWLRPYGLLPHPNILAGYLAIGLMAVIERILSTKKPHCFAYLLIFSCGLWAFLLTFSRAAWIGFGVAFALLCFYAIQQRIQFIRLFSVVTLAIVTGILFFIIYSPLILARVGVGNEVPELHSVGERTLLIDAALTSIDETPIFGVGAGNFPWRASYLFFEQDIPMRGDNVHNVLLTIWAEVGIVGFILISLASVVGVETILKRARSYCERERLERRILLLSFILLTTIGMFDHYPATLIQMQVLWWGILIVAMNPSHSVSKQRMLESF